MAKVRDEVRALDTLIPHSRNYNLHPERQVQSLADAMRLTAYTAPLIIKPDGTILGGHARRLALMKLRAEAYPEPPGVLPGWQVPCRVVECNAAEELKILATDNVDPAQIDYDSAGLASILADLQQSDDLAGTWYDAARLDALIAEVAGETGTGGSAGSGLAGPASSGATDSAPSPAPPASESEDAALIGYAVTRDGVEGRALLDQRKQRGMELVKRLKDAEGKLPEEVEFWAGRMAEMAAQHRKARAFECVTCPPPSGKREYSLAADLAERVARLLELPLRGLLTNPTPRGNRTLIHRKLSEETQYAGEEWFGSALLVDDAYCTGSTLGRCASALPGARLWFCGLARS